ncbi:hypothetical protein B0O80DRAFT_70154 [Mortierella sp. GBAus27b]|nr:hypothetical protein B0O80DRAFT_70154 [Mortierella sp. GBAus27b]
MQLEACQAARALNKSLRASVRGIGRVSRPSVPFNRSIYRPLNNQRSHAQEDTTREHPNAQDNDVPGLQQEFHARRIIQHFDSLSRKNTPPVPRHSLGIQRQGAAIKKKPFNTAFSRTLRTTTAPTTTPSTPDMRQDTRTTEAPLSRKSTHSLVETTSESQHMLRSMSSLDLLGTPVQITSRPTTDFSGTRSVRRDRPSSTVAAPGKRQEEMYLLQARLFQWYIVNKRAQVYFQEQEKSAKAQIKLVGRYILEKQVKLYSVQQRFEVENELVELESTLGNQVRLFWTQ